MNISSNSNSSSPSTADNPDFYLQHALQSLLRLPKDQHYQFELGITRVLQGNPHLASRPIRITGMRDVGAKYPLAWLLVDIQSNNYKLLKLCCDAYPSASSNLLHVACRRRDMSLSIIAMLARAVPPMDLRLKDRFQKKVLQYAHDNPSIIKALLPYNKKGKAIKMNRDDRGLDLLQQAIVDCLAVTTCKLIIHYYPKTITKFVVDSNLTIARDHTAEVLEQLLPSLPMLTSFSCAPRNWNSASVFTRILRLVKRYERISEFRMEHVVLVPELFSGLQWLLQGNSVLKKLHIGVKPPPAGQQQDWLQRRRTEQRRIQPDYHLQHEKLLEALSEGLESNSSLQLLMLSGLHLLNNERGANHQALMSIFRAAPRILMLSGMTFWSSANNEPEIENDNEAPSATSVACASDGSSRASQATKTLERESQIQFLKIQNGALSQVCLQNVLEFAWHNMPRLTRLELDIVVPTTPGRFYEMDITSTLVSLIKQGSLRHLVITGNVVQVNLETICNQALLQTRTLRHYNVPASMKEPKHVTILASLLEEHKITLEFAMELGDWSPPMNISGLSGSTDEEKIWYWTTLNKCGHREMVHNPNMGLGDFLRCLDRILGPAFSPTGNKISADSESSSRENWQCVFIYGLLRAFPGFWSRYFLLLMKTLSRSASRET